MHAAACSHDGRRQWLVFIMEQERLQLTMVAERYHPLVRPGRVSLGKENEQEEGADRAETVKIYVCYMHTQSDLHYVGTTCPWPTEKETPPK